MNLLWLFFSFQLFSAEFSREQVKQLFIKFNQAQEEKDSNLFKKVLTVQGLNNFGGEKGILKYLKDLNFNQKRTVSDIEIRKIATDRTAARFKYFLNKQSVDLWSNWYLLGNHQSGTPLIEDDLKEFKLK